MTSDPEFKRTIWRYYRLHRRPMPWRNTRDPYRILISEVMLQQTQVSRVEKFYEKFIKRFPNLRALAQAKASDVLRVWQGLGYNRRALALRELARGVMAAHRGRLPRDREALIAFPGIGPYTARAIRAFAWNEPEIFIETNIRRVFIHFFFPLGKNSPKNVTDAELRRYIERTLDVKNPREWYFALMDYGAMLGEQARMGAAAENPNRRSAHYVRQSKFSGSDRELRGKVLRELLAKKKIITAAIPRKIVKGLAEEGFLIENGKYIELAE